MENIKNILFINACARPESRTLLLAEKVLERLSGEVTELKLYEEEIAPLDYGVLEKRTGLIASGEYQDPLFRYARQFAEADEIVIAAPYWDLSFPSILKVYLEQICITGITFQYTPEGIPEGLCRARHIIYVTTAGGPVYQNMGFDYVKALSDTFFGIHEQAAFTAQNLDVQGADEKAILRKTAEEIENYSFSDDQLSSGRNQAFRSLNTV